SLRLVLKTIVMKKITLLLLFIGSYVSAQYTAIPDPNFEQALIDLGYDTMLDGQVLTDNIDDVISLDVSSKSISSLIGIEDFNALHVLMCHFNAISELDLSNNSQLHFFGCSNNQIEAIDFSNNILLESVDLRNNPLIVLDMSHNLALTNLAVWGS